MPKNKKFRFGFEIFENFQGMCFILSRDGKILNSNKSSQINLKIKEENLNGTNFFKLIDPDYQESAIELFSSSLNEDKAHNIPLKIRGKDKTYTVNLFFTPYKEGKDSSEINYCFVLARDITQEKKKEIDLLRFFSVAENTVNPLQITDINGKMIYVNPAFVNSSGYPREELIGYSPKVFGSGKHSKKFWAKMWETIQDGKVWVGEVENRKKSGEPFYTQLLISPILDEKGKVSGFFGIHRDLSEKKTLEKQLIHTQKMESIGTLAAGIAHEVGNPLASISAIVQVVLRSTDDDFIKEKLGLVKNQVTRISKIIRDLVDFSRPSNYELQVTDINKNITEAVEITKVGVKTKNIEIETKLNRDIPPLPLIADQLQQIFVNILLNAVDAITEKEDGRLNKINVTTDKTDDEVVITITDTGSGVPEEIFGKIFEPFFTTKHKGKGTGLGLWVSYGIIKSFQGDIKVKSKVGEGTSFIISIPINGQ